MVLLRNENKNRLIEKGLTFIYENKERVRIIKNDTRGNSVPNKKFGPIIELDNQGNTIKETYSDCPMMILLYDENLFCLTCWNWTPGPGPGDFELYFDNEDLLIKFIESYYFGENKYFMDRLEYELRQQH